MKIKSEGGFTLLELLVVLAFIAVILVIAIPNYSRTREESRKNTCLANLRQINSSIDQWAIENKITTGTVPSASDEEDIYSYLKGRRPRCPAGGAYEIHAVGSAEQVTCSMADMGHSL